MAGGSEGFVPLVGIPGLDKEPDFNSYVNALYALAISVAALIAVIQIVIGGAQYMMDDLITHKSAAKERIKNALIGLLIIIAAALILTTINSDLTHLNINAPRIEMDNSKPDPVLDDFEEICSAATTNNTKCGYENCDDIVYRNAKPNPNATDLSQVPTLNETCFQICRDVYQGIFDTAWKNQCFYTQAVADQCDPQQSIECCEVLKKGNWDSSMRNNNCQGLDEAKEDRIVDCYKQRMTWDDSNDTCRNAVCDMNTDARCCTYWAEGTYDNTTKTCSTDVTLPEIDPDTNYTYDGKPVQITVNDVVNQVLSDTITIKFDGNNNGVFGEPDDGETIDTAGCGWVEPSACQD